MMLRMCVLWAMYAASLRGHSRDQSWRPVHHLPLFQHAPGPLVAREMFRPVPHKSPLPHGLAPLLLPPAERRHSGHEQLSPPGPVDLWCGLRQVSVRVDRLRLRHWGIPGLFRLSSCPVSAATPRYLYFHRGLGECGGHVQVVGGQLVYRYSLSYDTPRQGSVLRVPPLELPLSCHYNRFHYSYRLGYQPLAPPSSFLKSARSRADFSLSVCSSQWEVLPPGHQFVLGEPVYFVARAGALLAGERLYVDSCHVTSSRDPSSTPRVDIITNHGCMTDSVRADSNSHFVSRGPSELRFSVDSLLFTTEAQMLFLHCSMSMGLQPSPISKSCTYSQDTGRWQELDASPFVCSCCNSVCGAPGDYVSSTSVSSAGWHFAQHQHDGSVSLMSRGSGLTEEPCTKDPQKGSCAELVNGDQWTDTQRNSATEHKQYKQHKQHTEPRPQHSNILLKSALINHTPEKQIVSIKPTNTSTLALD
ncbi:zona pellucida sperm-binding protein 3-like isoform X2 [Periophthalmus magnuspinnatus]|uniref:zona pellucida sperm-binding protein 3-like isoform X2 n=1 Tax=Periophthalmus magnuspinnatus TaxID=409849 RepID=UPI0024372C01|nr:zona pellucida sperm-binding protein 3-like isoform X2 [Periophthalmus magnuspinnatus]